MRRVVIGTAGHIDHGKTALVKALTGIDTDRLREEKERGISIDLGFAHLSLPDGTQVGLVDVPGHERFIKNMLAGVAGIDAVLFVIACDEGIMPQTREHFDIISLLGVRKGVFALTKTDLVERELVNIVEDEVREFLKPTAFSGSAIVPTSVVTGEGIEEIKREIEKIVAEVEERTIGEVVRLPIDRVFSMKGYGTVVTGTMWSGIVKVGDELVVLPKGKKVRVRSVQVHGKDVGEAFAGQRTALALHGVSKEEIERGDWVVTPNEFEPTSIVDCELYLLPSYRRNLASMSRVRFHIGAAEVMGRVYALQGDYFQPGKTAYMQMRLEQPVVCAYGDRFVIRTYSPMTTIGGGRVLDANATKHRRRDQGVIETLRCYSRGNMEEIVETFIRRSPKPISSAEIRRKFALTSREVSSAISRLEESGKVAKVEGELYLHMEGVADLEKKVIETLQSYQSNERLRWGMPKEELRERLSVEDVSFYNWLIERLRKNKKIFTRRGRVRTGSEDIDLSPQEREVREGILLFLRQNLFKPPSEKELASMLNADSSTVAKVVNLLIEEGTVLRLEQGLLFHIDAVEEARRRVVDYLSEHGEATASELKGELETTRKYAVPLLEYLDRLGVTRRSGDKRMLSRQV